MLLVILRYNKYNGNHMNMFRIEESTLDGGQGSSRPRVAETKRMG